MYVRPEYQGQGLGRALCERVIQEGKEKGYSLMRLDTEKTLSAAQHIYHSFGFKDAPPYYAAPPGISERAVFMELASALSQFLTPRSPVPSLSKPPTCPGHQS